MVRSDWDLWSQAHDMLLEHGSLAQQEARAVETQLCAAGDVEGSSEWRIVVARIEKLAQGNRHLSANCR